MPRKKLPMFQCVEASPPASLGQRVKFSDGWPGYARTTFSKCPDHAVLCHAADGQPRRGGCPGFMPLDTTPRPRDLAIVTHTARSPGPTTERRGPMPHADPSLLAAQYPRRPGSRTRFAGVDARPKPERRFLKPMTPAIRIEAKLPATGIPDPTPSPMTETASPPPG